MARSYGDSMRLLFVSKNYWPVSGEDELLSSALAQQLSGLGHHVTVLTWRMVRQWPGEFQMDGCQIVRVPQEQKTGWSQSALSYYSRNRWHRHMARWVSGNAQDFDAAIVIESPDEGMLATSTVGRAGLPTLSRVRQEHVFPVTRQLSRDLPAVTRRSTLFVTPDADLRQHREFAGSPLEGFLTHVPDGWPSPSDGVATMTQQTQRNVLGRVHPILKVDPHALLAVCGAELTFESGVFSLVRAWRRVLAAYPDSRLWLLGSGANTNELYQRICDLDMQHSVLLPGTFDEIRDVLAAADSYIMPGARDRLSWYSATALQLGLTVVHHQDSPVTQSFSRPHRCLPFDDESRSIDLVLSRWAAETRKREQPEVEDEQAAVVQVANVPDVRSMAQRYIELIESMRSASVTVN